MTTIIAYIIYNFAQIIKLYFTIYNI